MAGGGSASLQLVALVQRDKFIGKVVVHQGLETQSRRNDCHRGMDRIAASNLIAVAAVGRVDGGMVRRFIVGRYGLARFSGDDGTTVVCRVAGRVDHQLLQHDKRLITYQGG